MYPDCLNDLVGITDRETNCFDDAALNKSTIGLFVTQDPTYNHCRFRSGDTACDLIKLLLRVRDEAYRQTAMDIGAVLQNKVKTRQPYGYFIGQNKTGSYLANDLVPANPSLTINTEYRPGAFVEITRIALMVTPIVSPVTIQLRLVRVSDAQTLTTWDLTLISRSTKPVEVTPYKIPCDGDSYRVVYDFDGVSFYVPLTNYHCGCGDELKQAAGFIKENVSNTYGISIYANMYCDGMTTICALLKNDVTRAVIGYMVRMKIIQMALEDIYFRQEVNRFTLLTPEDMQGQIENYSLQYGERLKWIGMQTGFDVDGFCLQCVGAGAKKVNLLTGR